MVNDNLFTNDYFPESESRRSNRHGRKSKRPVVVPGTRPHDHPMLFNIISYEQSFDLDP